MVNRSFNEPGATYHLKAEFSSLASKHPNDYIRDADFKSLDDIGNYSIVVGTHRHQDMYRDT